MANIEISAVSIEGAKRIMKRVYPNYVIEKIKYTGKHDNVTGGKYYRIQYHYRIK
jgi:hypothetical protein